MGESMKKSYFEVLGLCCSSEVVLIERILKQLNGVQDISVIVPTKTLLVVHDTSVVSESKIVEALNAARLEASVRPQGETKLKNKGPTASTIACGLLLALSFLKCIYYPFGLLALVSALIGLPNLLMRSISSIRNLTLNINILVLIAVVGTLALQDYWEAGTIVFIFSIAQWLESRASYKAMATMSSLTNMAPQKAIITETGEQVDVNAVEVSTIIAVKAGDAIPIDGIVVEGKCEVDEKMLTGESFPVTKELDSTVWAGTINVNGYISIKTTALAKDTVVARMARLVEEAVRKKSRTQRLVDGCAMYYIPGVILISAGLALIPLALGVSNKKDWFHLALVVLVSACPCALILSTPVAIFCALTKSATSGLLLKGGEYLESLARIKTVAFDKTGTITTGELAVTEFHSVADDFSIKELLYWVSSIESKSSHPIAAALIQYARLNSIEPIPENVANFENFPGEGVSGMIDGRYIYIGNRKIGLRAGSRTDPSFSTIGEKAHGYIYSGAVLVGVFSLSDACRYGALEAMVELKSLGIKSAMLTGDSYRAAKVMESHLDHTLNVVHAELLPEDKAWIIKSFKKDGLTAMIGDGINDAPALASADVGISMGISGSALAMETGDAILMSNDLRKIPEAILLARRTFRKLVENLIVSIATKGAILALAFFGYPLIWAAVLTDVGTCLLVILNSMLILQEGSKHVITSKVSEYGTFPTSYEKGESNLPLNRQSDIHEGAGLLNAKNCTNECCSKLIHDVESTSRSNIENWRHLKPKSREDHCNTNEVCRKGSKNEVLGAETCCGTSDRISQDTVKLHSQVHEIESSTKKLIDCEQVDCKKRNASKLQKSISAGNEGSEIDGATINSASTSAGPVNSGTRGTGKCCQQSALKCCNKQRRADAGGSLKEVIID